MKQKRLYITPTMVVAKLGLQHDMLEEQELVGTNTGNGNPGIGGNGPLDPDGDEDVREDVVFNNYNVWEKGW